MSESDAKSLTQKVTKQKLEEEFVSPSEKAQALQTAIYECCRTQLFIGSVLQCMNITYSHGLRTAGVVFNPELKRWDLYINPKFFCHRLNNVKDPGGQVMGSRARRAVLLHELEHVIRKHPIRVPFIKLAPRKRKIMNVAADMAINQVIDYLPKGCSQCPPLESGQKCKNLECPGHAIFVEDYYDIGQDGKHIPWEKGKSMEYYYEKLLTKLDDPDKDDGDGEGEGEGDGEGSGSGDGIPDTIDEHIWDGSGEEKDMLEATEDLIKRAMIKQRCGFTDLPQSIKDLLSDIETRKVELDYKRMILSAIKRSASGHDRLHTWSRKSRRFGTKAPGTKIGDMPKLNFYLDTSGSISTEELNEFLEVVDNFLRTGNRKCRLNMFHTSNYYSSDYKLGQRLGKDGIQKEVQSGGTDLAESMKDIFKRKADLNVIVTDGYYGNVDVEAWMKANDHWPQTIFIISKDGEINHPLKRLASANIKIPQGLQPDKKL